MKTHFLLTLLSAASLCSTAFAGPDHEHGKKPLGPHGGRILTSVKPNPEFLVTPDRKVQITFLDEARKAVPPAGQVITVTTGDRMAPTKLTFVAKGNSLVSEQALPAGTNWPAVVQIKTAPDAKATVEKFNLNLATCPECKNPEYACTCNHSH